MTGRMPHREHVLLLGGGMASLSDFVAPLSARCDVTVLKPASVILRPRRSVQTVDCVLSSIDSVLAAATTV